MDNLLYGKLDDIAPHLTFSEYLFLAAVGIAYFLVQHGVLHLIIKFRYPGYMKLNEHDKTDYRMQWNGLIHGILSTIWSLYTIFWTCGDGKTFMNDE